MDGTNIINLSFGIGGIIIDLVLIISAVIFKVKDIGINYLYGYRTKFSTSSKEKWDWCNKVFVNVSLVISPILIIITTILMILAIINTWHVTVMAFIMFSSVFYILFLIPYIEIYGRIKFKDMENES